MTIVLPSSGQDLVQPHRFLSHHRKNGGIEVELFTGQKLRMFTTYSEVKNALTNPELTRTPPRSNGIREGFMAKFEDLMPSVVRIRKLTLPALSQRRMAEIKKIVLTLAKEDLDKLCKRESKFDLFTDYFLSISAQSLNIWLGVPEGYRNEHEKLYLRLSPDFGKDDDNNPEEALEQLLASFVRIVSTENPESGLIGDLRRKEVSANEIGTICCLMIMAGLEPTANASALASLALGLYDASETPGIGTPDVDELLRFDGPVFPGVFRWATETTTVGGTTISSGEMILLSLASANRDEERFVSADTVVPERQNSSHHLAFGAGLNRCVGAPLAKVILRCSLDALTEYEFRETDVKWRDFALRGFASISAAGAKRPY